MAKKKDSVALFEVIQKARHNQANTDVPKWMDGQKAAAPQAEAPQSVAPQHRTFRQTRQAGEPERLLSVDGDRLRLSLNYTSCAVVAACVVVLLVGAFALGYWSGSSGGPAGAPERRAGGPLKDRTPVGRHVLGGAVTSGGGPGEQRGPAASGRAQGKAYLVVQGLLGASDEDLEEAKRIAAWIGQQGEPATVARYTNPRTGKQRYIVWSLKPFPGSCIHEPDEAANAYARNIEVLGKRYFDKYKTYDFRQRMADGKFNPWFELQR